MYSRINSRYFCGKAGDIFHHKNVAVTHLNEIYADVNHRFPDKRIFLPHENYTRYIYTVSHPITQYTVCILYVYMQRPIYNYIKLCLRADITIYQVLTDAGSNLFLPQIQ